MLIQKHLTHLMKRYFTEYKEKNIVLYGANENTEHIIKILPEYNIIGVMDKELDGMFTGKPILTEDMVKQLQVDLIIIVEKNENIPFIGNELKDLCRTHGIKVFSVSGQSMNDFLLDGFEHNLCQDNQIEKETVDMLMKSNYRGLLDRRWNQWETKAIELFSKRISSVNFNISNMKDFSYCFLAPMITGFVFYLIDQMKEKKYDKVLFAARDSFLIQKLYEIAKKHYALEELPESVYFYTSRLACISAATLDEDDFYFINKLPCAYDPQYMTHYRYHIPLEKLKAYDKEKYSNCFRYLIEHKDIIFEHSNQLRNNYLFYMKKQGMDKTKRYAFVDLVSSGTCQIMMNRFTDYAIDGFYLGSYEVDGGAGRRLLPMKSYYKQANIDKGPYWKEYYMFDHYWFLETVLTSFEPSLHYFDEKGNPVLSKEQRSEVDLEVAKNLQDGILEFFDDFISGTNQGETQGVVQGVIQGETQQVPQEVPQQVPQDVPQLNPCLGDLIYRYSAENYTNLKLEYFDHQTLFEDLGLGVLSAKQI